MLLMGKSTISRWLKPSTRYIYINHDKTYNNHILIVYYKPIRQCFTDIPCFSPPGEGHQTFWPPSLPSFTTCTRTPERMPCQIKCQNILCNTVYILCTYCAHTYTHKHIHTYIHTYIYIYIYHAYFQMIRQKLCQKSVAGWGSLEVAGNSWCLLKNWWLELPLGRCSLHRFGYMCLFVGLVWKQASQRINGLETYFPPLKHITLFWGRPSHFLSHSQTPNALHYSIYVNIHTSWYLWIKMTPIRSHENPMEKTPCSLRNSTI